MYFKYGHPFIGVQSSYYWTSTTVADRTTDGAWRVAMFDGYVSANSKTTTNHVWPVRASTDRRKFAYPPPPF